jgi:hypothetical protein
MCRQPTWDSINNFQTNEWCRLADNTFGRWILQTGAYIFLSLFLLLRAVTTVPLRKPLQLAGLDVLVSHFVNFFYVLFVFASRGTVKYEWAYLKCESWSRLIQIAPYCRYCSIQTGRWSSKSRPADQTTVQSETKVRSLDVSLMLRALLTSLPSSFEIIIITIIHRHYA